MKADFIRKQKDQVQDYQKKLREEAIKERNREISAIIERLGDETHDTQKQLASQTEKKIREIEGKWRSDVDEYKALLAQWKEKFSNESECRKMLDDNLRVLGRRISELELELTGVQEKLGVAEKAKGDMEERLSGVHEQQTRLRLAVEEEMRDELETKERESRKLREQIQNLEHRQRSEVESMKLAKQQELEMIEAKIKQALSKKNEDIGTLNEEVRLRDMQIEKLKLMLDKQRREILIK